MYAYTHTTHAHTYRHHRKIIRGASQDIKTSRYDENSIFEKPDKHKRLSTITEYAASYTEESTQALRDCSNDGVEFQTKQNQKRWSFERMHNSERVLIPMGIHQPALSRARRPPTPPPRALTP
ncbi:hypothetical protein EVAR_34323_1 [Eumeta japonica]|uniref:Uncharacterized protein n=1 Tax=Eumeta variegata TaxID=151549 RepID=A0A4C1VDH0_EUMVA|nr:hypothetical protein EVAR_34323_1 [Eumeta japonica]